MKLLIKSVVALSFASMTISGCVKDTVPSNIELASSQSALKTMEHIALTANRCWFKSGNASFRSYGLAPELQSYSGRPRILVLPHNDPTGKPLLVVEAQGSPAKVSAYGPLMATSLGNTIAENLNRWVEGDNQC